MSKASRLVIFGDQSWPAESLGKFISDESEQAVAVWIDGRGWVRNKSLACASHEAVDTTLEAAQNLKDRKDEEAESVAIVGFEDKELAQQVVAALRAKRQNIKILQVGARGSRCALSKTKRSISWKDLFSQGVDLELQLLNLQDRVRDLRNFLKDSKEVAILLQDDPDPDGLAAALALRKVLRRNSKTAPIVSFGSISRPENVAMANLLDISVQQVDVDDLNRFDKVVMLDCQPSFFKGRHFKVDAIIDHHPEMPLPEGIEVPFVEMREDLGSISTLLTFYMRAAALPISQRLATALLYGIKSDTLHLNREVSDFDLSAFVYLYPLTNGNTLRRIERPELPMSYLQSLRRGLKYLQSEDSITVLPLAEVTREEWIPQAADFALQVEGSLWAMACGVFEGNLVISGRNCGYVQHCGDVFKKLFDELGCAGGHKSMAKAIIPKASFEKKYGAGSLQLSKLASILNKVLSDEIHRRESERLRDESLTSEEVFTV